MHFNLSVPEMKDSSVELNGEEIYWEAVMLNMEGVFFCKISRTHEGYIFAHSAQKCHSFLVFFCCFFLMLRHGD